MKFSSSIIFVASGLGAVSAFQRNLEEQHMDVPEESQMQRKLFIHYTRKGYFDKYLDIYQRCCGESLEECKCPVRETTWFGIKASWDKKCDISKLFCIFFALCSVNYLEFTEQSTSFV
jgi:hypothetical protein